MVQEAHRQGDVLGSAADARRADEREQWLVRFQGGLFGVDFAQACDQCSGRGLADGRIIQRSDVSWMAPVEGERWAAAQTGHNVLWETALSVGEEGLFHARDVECVPFDHGQIRIEQRRVEALGFQLFSEFGWGPDQRRCVHAGQKSVYEDRVGDAACCAEECDVVGHLFW